MRVAQGSERRIEVLYDADCGFCARTARLLRRLDRARRLELIPLQRAGASIGDAPPVDRLLARMHVRDAAGHWSIGGEGWLRIAEVVPALRPLARLGQLPFVRPFIGPVYGQVAKNRHRIGRLLGDGACAKPGLRR